MALRYRSAAPYTIYFTKTPTSAKSFHVSSPVRSNRKSNNLLFGSIEKAPDIRSFLLSVSAESVGTAESEMISRVIDSNAVTSIHGRKNAVTTLLTNAINRRSSSQTALIT